MFGTLVVVLPSPFTGGEMTLRQSKEEKEFDTSIHSKDQSSFICFYSDVFHKVHAVKSGYRLALVYNLVSKPGTRISAPMTMNESMTKLREMFAEWIERDSKAKLAPTFLAHVLKHQYSKFGLDFSEVKGKDKTKVNFLQTVAKELGFSIYLAQFDVRITGVGRELDMDRYSKSRKGKLAFLTRPWHFDTIQAAVKDGDDDDDSSDEEEDEDYYEDFSYGEFYDYTFLKETYREYELRDVIDPNGTQYDLSQFPVVERSLIPPANILKDWEMDDEESERFTGNDGGDIHKCKYEVRCRFSEAFSEIFCSILQISCAHVACEPGKHAISGQYS